MAQLLEVPEDGDPDLDMGLNDPVLFGVKRAVLQEHMVVDADLADVVQKPGQVEVAALLRRHAQLFRQADRDSRHALGMPGGVGILGVDGRGQGTDDPEEEFLEFGVDLGVAGLRGDERRHVLHPLDLGSSDQAIIIRIDHDEPARGACGHRGEPAHQGR